MTNADVLLALAERVEAPDGDIRLLLPQSLHAVAMLHGAESVSRSWDFFWPGAYLDAIEALRVAKLPGWHWYVGNSTRPGKPPWIAELYHPDGERVEPGCYATVAYPGRAPTELAARLAAVLRALAAKETDDA